MSGLWSGLTGFWSGGTALSSSFAGFSGGGGLSPSSGSGPPPVPEALVISMMGQSEMEYIMNPGGFYRNIPQPSNVPNGNVVMYTIDGAGGPVVTTTVNPASVAGGLVNPAMAAMACALGYVHPNKTFHIADCAVAGTGRTDLGDDTTDPGDGRLWTDLTRAVSAAESGAGRPTDLVVECWYRSDSGFTTNFINAFWPIYFGSTGAGGNFTLGTVNAAISRQVDHCLWDAQAPTGSNGRGIYTRDGTEWTVLTPMSDIFAYPVAPTAEAVNFTAVSSTMGEPRRQIIMDLAANPIAQTVGINVGPSAVITRFNASGTPGGATHPSITNPDGQIGFMWPFFVAIANKAGSAIQEPYIESLEAATDGSWCDVFVRLPNGGNLTTKRILESRAPISSSVPHRQQVIGFEVARGGTFRPVFNTAEVSYPANTRGTVTIADTGSGTPRRGRVRIVPTTAFAFGDALRYLAGGASAVLQTPRDIGVDADMLLETIPALRDTSATYPFPGVAVRPYQEGFAVPVPAPPPGTEFTINSDADWSAIPASFLTSGGTVLVNPAATYTSKTLNMRPTSTLIFDTLIPGQFPRLPNFNLDDVRNVDFRRMEFVAAQWQENPRPAVALRSLSSSGLGISNLFFRGCRFVGNYQGTIFNGSNFNPNDGTLPEYASVTPVFDASGAVVGMTVVNSQAGPLTPDGVVNLTFTNYSNVTFTTLPQVQMTVLGGVIQPTFTIISGGTSNATTATNSQVGILTALVNWKSAGQRRMIDWMPDGVAIRADSGYRSEQVVVGDVGYFDCYFGLLNNAIKYSAGPTAASPLLTVRGCEFDICYQDEITYSVRQCDPEIVNEWNFHHRGIGRTGDPGDPHRDVLLQLIHSVPLTSSTTLRKITVRNNIYIADARGVGQGALIGDQAPNGGYGGTITGNIILSLRSGLGINVQSTDGAYIMQNAAIRWNPADPTNAGLSAVIRAPAPAATDFAYNQSVMGQNIADAIASGAASVSGGRVDRQTFPNRGLGPSGSITPYTTAFPAFGGPKTTIAQVVAAMTPAPAFAAFGPVRSGRDYLNRTEDPSLLPPYVGFVPEASEPQNTAITTEWRRVIGPNGIVNFTCTNGLLQVADDASGTNSTTPAAAGTFTLTYANKFVRIVGHQTAVGPSQPSTSTVTLNGQAYTFVSITATSASYPQADNQATAYSTFARPSPNVTGLNKMLLAFRAKADVFTGNANVMANAAASQFRVSLATVGGGEFRAQLVSSAACSARFSAPSDTNFHTHLVAIDFSQTEDVLVAKWVRSFIQLPLSSASTIDISGTRTFATDTIFTGNNAIGVFAESDGGGTFFDGRMEWVWLDFYSTAEAIPDILDPTVQAAFSADRFAEDGSVSGIIRRPFYFYQGAVSSWNASITNAGTVSATLTRISGTYV